MTVSLWTYTLSSGKDRHINSWISKIQTHAQETKETGSSDVAESLTIGGGRKGS